MAENTERKEKVQNTSNPIRKEKRVIRTPARGTSSVPIRMSTSAATWESTYKGDPTDPLPGKRQKLKSQG